jgi:DNA topoisomerase-1
MILFVVESPNKAKKIRQYFPDFQVIATVGHFRDLPEDRIGVEPPTHKPEYVTCQGKSEIEAKLRVAATKAQMIYLATDPDREGEAIASHVYQCVGAKFKDRMKRVTYDQVSKKAIEQAIAKARGVDWALVAAQEARRVIDRYVGYLVSPVLTSKLRAHNSRVRFLSAGRVQSVTLKLIVERQQEIENFKPVEHYGITLRLSKAEIPFHAQWLPFFRSGDNASLIGSDDTIEAENEACRSEKLMTDKALAKRVLERTVRATVETVSVRDVPVSPPPPLMTTTYVQMVVSALKVTTKKAMDFAQKLFEQGLITYHRTDSPSMSDDFVAEVWRFATEHNMPLPKSAHVYNPKDGAQAGHECLRVTNIGVPTVRLADPTQELVYHLIWLRSLQSQLAPAIDTRSVAIFHNGHGDRFASRGAVEKTPGWRVARKCSMTIHKATEDAEKSQQESTLPALSINESVTLKDKSLDVKKTKPPSVFTEKSLVQKLDQLGIGRPSTYAQAIERIVEQQYVGRDSKLRLTPTDLGRCVVQCMDSPFAFMNYAYTAELEEYLDLIAEKKGNYQELVHAVYTSLTADLELFEARPLETRIVEQLSGLSATYPTASETEHNRGGKSGNKKKVRKSRTVSCAATRAASISQKNVSRETPGRYPDLHDGDACPLCRVGLVRQNKFKSGQHEGQLFMGCSIFPNCRFFQWAH